MGPADQSGLALGRSARPASRPGASPRGRCSPGRRRALTRAGRDAPGDSPAGALVIIFWMASGASNGEQDFRAHLIEQLGFLNASAAAYDDGVESEAKRLAVAIRTLVHDGSGSRSLLTLLGVRDRLPWTDSAAGVVREAALAIGSGLCVSRMDLASGESRFAAPLDNLPPERIHPGAAFVDWWKDPVLTDADGREFSRRDLVLGVANKDGGAHVDAALPPAYRALTRDNSIGMTQSASEGPNSAALGFGITVAPDGLARGRVDGPPLENSLALAHVRQITWEFRDTIRRHLVVEAERPYVRASICPLSIHTEVRADRDGRCPCGSGRAFERCFGRRLPRRSFSIYDLARHAA
jgi:hypothetical protein